MDIQLTGRGSVAILTLHYYKFSTNHATFYGLGMCKKTNILEMFQRPSLIFLGVAAW